jgi:hypothetical protein
MSGEGAFVGVLGDVGWSCWSPLLRRRFRQATRPRPDA